MPVGRMPGGKKEVSMGFFARLKWLLVGEGEAPSGFKTTAHQPRRPESNPQSRPMHGRDHDHRGPRDRDNRGERYPRDSREPRDSRPPREPREPRGDRDRQPRSGGYNRDGGDNRYSERDRGNSFGSRRSGSQGNYSRRDSNGGDGSLPRQIERPMGGPSSTMRPAQSSAQEGAPVQVARPEQQGPEKVGVVTHYLDDARVANIKIEKGFIRAGDWIEIQGNISSLRQKVDSIQLDNQPIQEAHEGQDVGIRVIRPVKAGDAIVRLRG